MRPNTLLYTALFLITATFWGSTTAQAQCMPPTFFADLKTGWVLNGDPTLFKVLSPPTPSTLPGCAGWQEMVVQIDIPDNCTTATLNADYEGTPQRWTLNIGDSPTNNGYSGDAGTTQYNAELWIENETLSLASGANSPLLIDSPLVHNHVSLTDGGMKFLIKDQFVSWGQPYQFAQTGHNKILFAIPDNTMPTDQRSIYAGLNRVIDGAPWNGRTGCGLRSVLIRFQ